MDIIGVDQAKKWLTIFATTIREARIDKQYIIDNGRIVYNVDFNLLAPLLADAAPVGLPQFFLEHRDHYAALLDKIKENSQVVLAISEPTVLEVMDMLLHKKNRLAKLQEKASTFSRRLDSDLPLTETEAIRKEFIKLTQSERLDNDSKKIADDLCDLLKTKKVVGAGDVIDKREVTHSKNMFALFNKVYKQQYEKRSARDSRNPEDKEFHYKIDALNICITLATATSTPQNRTFFVSGTGVNTNLCFLHQISYGRKPLVPVIVQNAIEIDGMGKKDIVLHETEEYIKFIIKAVDRCGSLNDRLLGQLAELKGDYLNVLSGEDMSQVQRAHKPGSRAHFEDPKEFQREAIKQSSLLKDGAAAIAEEIVGKVDYLERFQIFEDPIVRKIEAELGIRLRPGG